MMSAPLFPCPCCGAPVVSEPGGYELCSLCGWEDDPVQSADPNFGGGVNELSLTRHRDMWLQKFRLVQGQRIEK
jgi:hypothetical protein